MASGDTLITLGPENAVYPSSGSIGVPDSRNDHPVVDFDAASDDAIYFEINLPRQYDGGGLTATITWMASTATSGVTVWALAVERHQDDVDDLDSDSFAADNTVDATAASASGEKAYDTIAFTDGADMDSLAAGEDGRLRLRRLGSSDGDDTMSGDAEWCKIEIRET